MEIWILYNLFSRFSSHTRPSYFSKTMLNWPAWNSNSNLSLSENKFVDDEVKKSTAGILHCIRTTFLNVWSCSSQALLAVITSMAQLFLRPVASIKLKKQSIAFYLFLHIFSMFYHDQNINSLHFIYLHFTKHSNSLLFVPSPLTFTSGRGFFPLAFRKWRAYSYVSVISWWDWSQAEDSGQCADNGLISSVVQLCFSWLWTVQSCGSLERLVLLKMLHSTKRPHQQRGDGETCHKLSGVASARTQMQRARLKAKSKSFVLGWWKN